MQLPRLNQQLISAAAVLLLQFGCNFEESRPGAAQPGQSDLQAAQTTCDSLMKELFLPSCASCHNHGRSSGGINLTTIESIQTSMSMDGRALITPGDPAASLLLQIIRSGEMPPQGDIDPAQLEKLECWIKSGAKDDDYSCQTTETPKPNLIIVIEPVANSASQEMLP
jgi:hypothetical protein